MLYICSVKEKVTIMTLSSIQLERQDFVDNKLMTLLQEVNPTDQSLQWDIEVIGDLHDIISDYFQKKGICTKEDFYPEVK